MRQAVDRITNGKKIATDKVGVIPSVACIDPEVARMGLTAIQAKAQGIKVKKTLSPGPHARQQKLRMDPARICHRPGIDADALRWLFI